MLLSICITVFNQVDIVRNNLDELHRYVGDDIEVIVSDDNSTDDISLLVASYGDGRFKYFSTRGNMGHDRNILFALSKAQGEFAVVLRSRDKIIADSLSKTIGLIEKHKDGAYLLFSAMDQDGKCNVLLGDKVYAKGKGALNAHFKLIVHPSGNIYNMHYLDESVLLSLDQFMIDNFDDKFAFIVHDLIRMQLAVLGRFYTFSHIGWIYDRTKATSAVAVNARSNGKSVYAPELSYRRLDAEVKYVGENKLFDDYVGYIMKMILRRFFKAIVYDFSLINKDKVMQKHYKFEQVQFDLYGESKVYLRHAFKLLDSYKVITGVPIKLYLVFYAFKIVFYYGVRDKVMHAILSEKSILKLHKLLNGL